MHPCLIPITYDPGRPAPTWAKKPAPEPQTYPASYHGDPDATSLLPKAAIAKLFENGDAVRLGTTTSDALRPVVKIAVPFGGPAWLLISIGHDAPMARAIVDDGCGGVEDTVIDLRQVLEARGSGGLPAERCLHFEAEGDCAYTLSRAQAHGSLAF